MDINPQSENRGVMNGSLLTSVKHWKVWTCPGTPSILSHVKLHLAPLPHLSENTGVPAASPGTCDEFPQLRSLCRQRVGELDDSLSLPLRGWGASRLESLSLHALLG